MTLQTPSAQGLYIHVPFCVSRCIYCDFYSSTYGLSVREDYTRALVQELQTRAAETEGRPLQTIYFGGGTPSQLAPAQLARIFRALYDNYGVVGDAEITFEANPDDITPQLLEALRAQGVNRVSLGVQTFDDEVLRFIHRRHTAKQAADAVNLIRTYLTANISVDLIYGLPVGKHDALAHWQHDLSCAFSLPVTHLSAYALSYEAGTKLHALRAAGQVHEVEDETSLAMYEMLLDRAQHEGFDHYEISNFARPGFRSRHNSSYWQGIPYIGCGPGAHSYDGRSVRRQNLPDVRQYVTESPQVPHTLEHLSLSNIYDEFVMTQLRTKEGLLLSALSEKERAYLLRQAQPFIRRGLLRLTSDRLALTRDGLFLSDGIMTDLMAE